MKNGHLEGEAHIFPHAMTCRVCFSGHTHASIAWIFLPIHPTQCYMRNCSSLWKRPALLALNEDFSSILVTCVHCMLLSASVFLVSWVRSGQNCMHKPRVCTDETVYAKRSLQSALTLRASTSAGVSPFTHEPCRHFCSCSFTRRVV